MKIKQTLLIATILVLPLLYGCVSSSIASSDNSNGTSSINTSISSEISIPLAVPKNIALSERLITWTAVTGADSYDIRLNETDDHTSNTNEFTLPDRYFGPISIEIRSRDGTETSDYSEPYETIAILHLSSPTSFRQEGTMLYWDEVAYATGYMVNIDEVDYFTATNSYSISIDTPSTAKVMATGRDDGYVTSSPFTDPIYIKVMLDTPTQITYDDGVLSWAAVDSAASYEILVNDEDTFTSGTTSIYVGFDYVGDTNFKVRAIATGNEYLNSAWGTTTISIAPLTLEAPTNLYIDGSTLHFDAVDHADGYQIYVDGVSVDTTNTNSYLLDGELISQTGSYIQVGATSVIHNDSPLSNKLYLGTIELSTEAELRAITSSGSYTLIDDIVLTSVWTPIDFEGYFNGLGHTISGIDIEAPSAGLENIGFFGSLEGATINNLVLSGEIAITATYLEPNVGGLAGKSTESNLDNIDISFDISLISNNGIADLGGFIGEISDTIISDSTYSGSIEATNAIGGGFIGYAKQSNSAVSIEQSGATGAITVNGGEQSPTGGFIGKLVDNYMTIQASMSEITISGPNYVGGFVGYMGSGTITNAYTRGLLTATNASYVHAGGFIGRMEGYNNDVSFAIAMVEVAYTASDTSYAGAFSGTTPGGTLATLYEECYYDSDISSLDRIGNPSTGRGDGITGLTSSSLLEISTFDPLVWDFSGMSPTLDWEA